MKEDVICSGKTKRKFMENIYHGTKNKYIHVNEKSGLFQASKHSKLINEVFFNTCNVIKMHIA